MIREKIHTDFYKGYEFNVSSYTNDLYFTITVDFSIFIPLNHLVYKDWDFFERELCFSKYEYRLEENGKPDRDELEITFHKLIRPMFVHCTNLTKVTLPLTVTPEYNLDNKIKEAKRIIDILYLLENRLEFYR